MLVDTTPGDGARVGRTLGCNGTSTRDSGSLGSPFESAARAWAGGLDQGVADEGNEHGPRFAGDDGKLLGIPPS